MPITDGLIALTADADPIIRKLQLFSNRTSLQCTAVLAAVTIDEREWACKTNVKLANGSRNMSHHHRLPSQK